MPIELISKNKPHVKSQKAIVFVHGLNGSSETWHGRKDKYWEVFLNNDFIKKNFTLFIFRYDTKIIDIYRPFRIIQSIIPSRKKKSNNRQGFNVSIRKISLELETEIRETLSNFKSIVIVAHSMGGLVSKKAICYMKNDSSKIDLFVSLSVPHQGSILADIGGLLGLRNKQIVSLHTFSEFTTDLTRDYASLKNKPKTIYQAGNQDMVVPEASAIPPSAKKSDLLVTSDDHFSILKISKPSMSSVFQRIHRELREICDGKINQESGNSEEENSSGNGHSNVDDMVSSKKNVAKNLKADNINIHQSNDSYVIKENNITIIQNLDSSVNNITTSKSINDFVLEHPLIKEKDRRILELKESMMLLKETKEHLSKSAIDLSEKIENLEIEKDKLTKKLEDIIELAKTKGIYDKTHNFKYATDLVLQGKIDDALSYLDEDELNNSELAHKNRSFELAFKRLLKANVYYLKNDLINAIKNFKIAVEIFPSYASIYPLARLLVETLQFDQAKSYIDKLYAIKISSLELAQTKMLEANIIRDQNFDNDLIGMTEEKEKALELFEEAHELFLALKDSYSGSTEDIIRSYNNLGAIYKTKGDLDRAEEYFEKAADIMLHASVSGKMDKLSYNKLSYTVYRNLFIIEKERNAESLDLGSPVHFEIAHRLYNSDESNLKYMYYMAECASDDAYLRFRNNEVEIGFEKSIIANSILTGLANLQPHKYLPELIQLNLSTAEYAIKFKNPVLAAEIIKKAYEMLPNMQDSPKYIYLATAVETLSKYLIASDMGQKEVTLEDLKNISFDGE